MNTVKRIKEFIDYKGISVRKFEEIVGFSNGSFASQYKNNKTIGVDKVENILHIFPEINSEWLLTGEGEMIRETYQSRLRKIIDSTNLTVDGFRKSLDSPMLLFNDVLDGKYKLASATLDKISAKYPNINLDWLLSGKGEMLKNINEDIQSTEKNRQVETIEKLDNKYIPLVEPYVIAGFGNTEFSINETDVKEYYVIPKFKHNKIDFMIEVRGESMQPKYSAGDIIACIILKESSFIQWNKIHVIATKEQGILVKRIKKGNTDNTIILISDNPEYDPFEVPKEEIKGMALVVGAIKLE